MSKVQYIEKQLRAEVATLLLDSRNLESKVQSYLNKLFINVIENNITFSLINELYNGLNEKTINKKLIKAWIHRYTPIRWDEEKQEFDRLKKAKWDRALLNEGMHNPWYSYVPKERKESEKQWDKAKSYKSISRTITNALTLASNAGDEESIKLLTAILDSLK